MAGTDNNHGERGGHWLAQWFPESVSEPVRLHVAAKRYLCAAEPAYFGQLSEASVYTLSVQGGPMSDAEAREFEREPSAAGTTRPRTRRPRPRISRTSGRCSAACSRTRGRPPTAQARGSAR